MAAVSRIIVTGTAGALGGAVAEHFTAKGIEVIGLDVAYENTALAASDEHDGLHTMKVDLTSAEDVRGALTAIRDSRGQIDGLVHCTGGFRWSQFHEISDKDVEFLVHVNLLSTLWMVRGVLSDFREQGFGRIVLVSSRSTLAPGVGEGAYTASKAGLNALVKSVAAEVTADDITINAVLPSIINTAANRAEMPDADHSTWVPLDSLAAVIGNFFEPVGAPLNGALLPVSGRT